MYQLYQSFFCSIAQLFTYFFLAIHLQYLQVYLFSFCIPLHLLVIMKFSQLHFIFALSFSLINDFLMLHHLALFLVDLFLGLNYLFKYQNHSLCRQFKFKDLYLIIFILLKLFSYIKSHLFKLIMIMKALKFLHLFEMIAPKFR